MSSFPSDFPLLFQTMFIENAVADRVDLISVPLQPPSIKSLLKLHAPVRRAKSLMELSNLFSIPVDQCPDDKRGSQ